MTLGVVYSLFAKGPLLVMVNQMSKAQKQLVEERLGGRVVLYEKGKWMTGKVHTELLLPNMVVPFAERLRQLHEKLDSKVM